MKKLREDQGKKVRRDPYVFQFFLIFDFSSFSVFLYKLLIKYFFATSKNKGGLSVRGGYLYGIGLML